MVYAANARGYVEGFQGWHTVFEHDNISTHVSGGVFEQEGWCAGGKKSSYIDPLLKEKPPLLYVLYV